jgi:hypothetical protein
MDLLQICIRLCSLPNPCLLKTSEMAGVKLGIMVPYCVGNFSDKCVGRVRLINLAFAFGSSLTSPGQLPRNLLHILQVSWNNASLSLRRPELSPRIIHGWFSVGPPLWSSGHSPWLQIQKSRVRFLALPDFLRSNGSGTGSTHPREYNWGATCKKK